MDFKQKHKIFILSVLWALFIFIFLIFFQNILAGEEARVRKFILKGKKAAESKDIFTCADMISSQYHDKYGNDRQSLIYASKEAFTYYKNIFIHIENMDIKLDDSKKEASVEIVALVIGQTQDNKAEKIIEADKARSRVRLIKENKKWQLLEIEFFETITVMGQNIT